MQQQLHCLQCSTSTFDMIGGDGGGNIGVLVVLLTVQFVWKGVANMKD
jgi:hypothetical protein